jgi:hypothetical protein
VRQLIEESQSARGTQMFRNVSTKRRTRLCASVFDELSLAVSNLEEGNLKFSWIYEFN